MCIYSVESSSATFSYVFHRSISSSLTRSSRVHHVVTSLTRASSSSSPPPVVHTRVYTAVRTHSEGANEKRTLCCTDSPAAAMARPKLSTLTSTAPVSFGASGQSLPPMDALATGASASASASPDHLQPGPSDNRHLLKKHVHQLP